MLTSRPPTIAEIAAEALSLAGIGQSNNRLIALGEEALERVVAEAQAQHHSPECIKAQLALVQYLVKLPKACLSCYATGEVDDSDPSVGLSGTAPCGKCVEQGNCPRCGHGIHFIGDVDDETIAICLTCGWKTGAARTMPAHECDCWWDAAQRAEQLYAQTYAEFDV